MYENITKVQSEPSGEEEAKGSSWHLVGRSKLDLRSETNEESEHWEEECVIVSAIQRIEIVQDKHRYVRCDGESR